MNEEMERNENGFVSLWTDKVKLDCATLYANSVMNDDPFFNRVADINCKEFDAMLDNAEKEFSTRNVKPFVHCLSNEQLMQILEKRGYVWLDTVIVLLYEGRYKSEYPPEISVKKASHDNMKDWVDAFCLSFDSENWRVEIAKRVSDAIDHLHLYVAYVRNVPVGCVALFEANSLLGLYCLGTLEKHRGKGIATALISVSTEIAEKNNLRLFLQTFKTQGLIRYYVKRGFTQVYAKEIYTKPLTS